MSGREVLGYLAFHGAIVDNIDDYYILQFHSKFDIIIKICEKLLEQRNRQEIGLVQRGAARKDSELAQDFVSLLMRLSWTQYDRTMIAISPAGRGVMREFIENKKIHPEIADFLRKS